MTAVLPEGELALPPDRPYIIQPRDLAAVLEAATQSSAHTVADQVRAGFVTLRGGHRLGLCGNAATQGGALHNIRHLSSLSLRIAREFKGISDEILPYVYQNGGLQNTLILSPPGLGKTTLLRDLVRNVSSGSRYGAALRVSLADERGEVAALYMGQPQFDVGPHTDVLDGCPKAAAVLWLLRAMSPQVVALDEITAPEDIQAIETARNCGAALLATCHARGLEDLRGRPLYRGLFEIFRWAVLIRQDGGGRKYQLLEMKSL